MGLAADSTRGGFATLVSAAGAAGLSERLSLVFSNDECEGIGAACCEEFEAELSAGGAGFCADLAAFLLCAAAGMGFSAGGAGGSPGEACPRGARGGRKGGAGKNGGGVRGAKEERGREKDFGNGS